MSQRIILPELSRAGVSVRLDSDTAAALAATKLVEVRTEGSGVWRLSPNGRVGAVSIGAVDGIDVQVIPKVSISSLLFLLGYATNPGFRPEDVSGQPEPDVWPALAESLVRLAERAFARGIRQGYVTIDNSLALVRGRIRVADQIARRPGVMLPLEVRYDEYSPDIAENQIIRTALRQMIGLPRLASALRARLIHLDVRLGNVTVLRAGSTVPQWRATRLNAGYAPAVHLAEIVLRHQSAEAGPGGVSVASFVVNMAKVFEDFLLTALCEALVAHPGHTQGQYPVHLDKQQQIPMKPDVVHVVDGRPVAVFDAKYKLEDPTSGYPNADAYQMLAYCTALRLRRGWLVYAEGIGGTARKIQHADVEIMPFPLDLSQPPNEILRQIDTLARAAVDLTMPVSSSA